MLVLVMIDHHWNGETGINLFGQTGRKRDRETDRQSLLVSYVMRVLQKWTPLQSLYFGCVGQTEGVLYVVWKETAMSTL